MDTSQVSRDLIVVTPSDNDPCTGVGFVFAGGDCAVVTAAGRTVVVPEALAGITFVASIVKVLATGTTATAIVVYPG